jgi:hypothetical protein
VFIGVVVVAAVTTLAVVAMPRTPPSNPRDGAMENAA